MNMPFTTSQSFTSATAKDEFNDLGRRVQPGSVHTGILLDDEGIVEVYHQGRQATEMKVGYEG